MKRNYKKFIISSVIIIAGFLAMDFLIGIIENKLIELQPDNSNAQITKVNYNLNREHSDILILGSSRCYYHYVPSIIKSHIDSISNKDYSVFNLGINGFFLNYNCCLIESLLRKYTPKLIILETSDERLENIQEIHYLYPFFDENEIIQKYTKQLGLKEYIKLHFNSYKFNNMIIPSIYGLMTPKDKGDGYYPRYGSICKDESLYIIERLKIKENMTINPILKKNLTNVFKLCKDKGVTLVVFSSPQFGYYRANKNLAQLCKEHDIPYFDMMANDYFNTNYKLFKDAVHLNDDGAKEFTTMICDSITPIIKEHKF